MNLSLSHSLDFTWSIRLTRAERWRTSGRCLLPPISFPSPSVSVPLLSCSFSLSIFWFSDRGLFFSVSPLGLFVFLLWWFRVCSWRWIIRLTNACSFPALHLRFENKGKAGLLSFCSLPISLFLGPLSVFVHALHWPLGSALSSPHSPALSHLLWLYSQRIATIWNDFHHLLQQRLLRRKTKKAINIF